MEAAGKYTCQVRKIEGNGREYSIYTCVAIEDMHICMYVYICVHIYVYVYIYILDIDIRYRYTYTYV